MSIAFRSTLKVNGKEISVSDFFLRAKRGRKLRKMPEKVG